MSSPAYRALAQQLVSGHATCAKVTCDWCDQLLLEDNKLVRSRGVPVHFYVTSSYKDWWWGQKKEKMFCYKCFKKKVPLNEEGLWTEVSALNGGVYVSPSSGGDTK